MFFIFKPPYSLVQAQIVDPDGIRRKPRPKETDYEIELALKILQERKPKTKKKRKKELKLKQLIENQLDIGATIESAVSHVVDQSFEVQAEIDAILQQYFAELNKLEIERKKRKGHKVKVLLLMAMMDE